MIKVKIDTKDIPKEFFDSRRVMLAVQHGVDDAMRSRGKDFVLTRMADGFEVEYDGEEDPDLDRAIDIAVTSAVGMELDAESARVPNRPPPPPAPEEPAP